MPDTVDPQKRSEIMSRIRARDTSPEKRVRQILHRMGYRFRLHLRDLPGTPDIVLAKYETVIFVHGCFWHQHTCRDGKTPKSNQSYWLPKLERNRRRDRSHSRALRRLGWHVVVVWECEARDEAKVARRLDRILISNHRKACQRGE